MGEEALTAQGSHRELPPPPSALARKMPRAVRSMGHTWEALSRHQFPREGTAHKHPCTVPHPHLVDSPAGNQGSKGSQPCSLQLPWTRPGGARRSRAVGGVRVGQGWGPSRSWGWDACLGSTEAGPQIPDLTTAQGTSPDGPVPRVPPQRPQPGVPQALALSPQHGGSRDRPGAHWAPDPLPHVSVCGSGQSGTSQKKWKQTDQDKTRQNKSWGAGGGGPLEPQAEVPCSFLQLRPESQRYDARDALTPAAMPSLDREYGTPTPLGASWLRKGLLRSS